MTDPCAPLQVEPSDGCDAPALVRLVTTRHDELTRALHRHGALLMRGFAIATAAQFGAVVRAFSQDLQHYSGGASPRRALAAGPAPVYDSTSYPPDLALPLHNELSYADDFPRRIYFACLAPATSGGATTLGDSRRILAAIPADIRAEFAERGVQYVRLLGPEKGSGYAWQDAFGSDDRAAVERRCAAAGAEHEWLPGDMLRLVQRRPAIIRHPVTGEAVWFNQVAGFHPRALDPASYAELTALRGDESRFRLNVRFGDGGAIPAAVVDRIAAVLAAAARPHEWQKGDLLMLDNILYAHGRAPFAGPRSIAVAMSG